MYVLIVFCCGSLKNCSTVYIYIYIYSLFRRMSRERQNSIPFQNIDNHTIYYIHIVFICKSHWIIILLILIYFICHNSILCISTSYLYLPFGRCINACEKLLPVYTINYEVYGIQNYIGIFKCFMSKRKKNTIFQLRVKLFGEFRSR